MRSSDIRLFWFRRDLRLEDNAALYHALKNCKSVYPIFIFDRHILDHLPVNDARVSFIHTEILKILSSLIESGGGMNAYYGHPEKIIPEILDRFPEIGALYTNKDYEPYAKDRDQKIMDACQSRGVEFHTFKDHLIFAEDEVLKDDGKPYTVFTPYKKKWLLKLESLPQATPGAFYLKPYPSSLNLEKTRSLEQGLDIPSLPSMGFELSDTPIPSCSVDEEILKHYDQKRDFPAIKGTSRLGLHLRFGTISIRKLGRRALLANEVFLSELVWRDFYAMILWHFPHVATQAFRPEYDRIQWRNDEADFEKWKQGLTGYPIVDAGMRELNTTGYMHNRVRMVVASFLTKHLLIDWRWGEAYFAEKLLDFDLASNNGGWQWAAGSGTDAAPYFRIFNPQAQQAKFDPKAIYIKKWVPEVDSLNYPRPMVDHKTARDRCLSTYKAALAKDF